MVGLGRLYVVEFHAVAITAVQDLFYLKPAADKPIWIEEAHIDVVGGTADAGDAQEELLRIEIIKVPATVTVGSGGGSFTPTPINTNDAAAGFTARINDTTPATTSGTLLYLDSGGMNSRTEYKYLPLPENRMPCANAQALVLRLNTAPNDSILVSGSMLVRELI